MSAFMVSKEHIDLLVNLVISGPRGVRPTIWHAPYFNNETVQPSHADVLGEMLVKENLSSIHSRYPDTLTNPDNTPGPCDQYWLASYTFDQPHYRLTVVEAFTAISCYEYQACEHDEWEHSEARQYCESLRHSLARCLPGYDDAPWEWTAETVAKARMHA